MTSLKKSVIYIRSDEHAAPVARGNRTVQVIPHREAMRVLLSDEAAQVHPEHVRSELPAIISHWLQSPQQDPIILGSSAAFRWRVILATYARTGLRPPVETPDLPKNPTLEIDFSDLPFPPVKRTKFTFMDLFAGIGGFRIALQEQGGKCVFSSEWNKAAKETYYRNYGEVPFGDITKLSGMKRMDQRVDVIAGGFPCQPFSRAGVSARNSLGQSHGFNCETQGLLFFNLIELAQTHKPKVLFLENVGNLMRHDGGNTFAVIRREIEQNLGYYFYSSVYNVNTLVPQNRVRCIIVAFRNKPPDNWQMPVLSGKPLPLRSILEDVAFDSPYTLSERMWEGHIKRSKRNVARGAGFTAYPKDLDKPSTTLVARYYKDGKECLIPQGRHPKRTPRMLTERECARLQGFPEKFILHPSKVNAYKQFGNAVPVPLVATVAETFVRIL